MSSLTFMVKVLNKPMVPLVGVMTGLLWISVLVVSFGINTSCTNAWSCTSSNCQPCRIVGFASLGGLLVGTAIGAGALFAPFPRFGRRFIYVTSMITLIICIAVIAGSWSQPQ